MIYAGIVAGGTGTRMGADIPKQFLKIGGKPILVRTAEKFLTVEEIDRVYIAVHPDWVEFTNSLAEKYFSGQDKLIVIAGGKDRNATVFNILNDIEKRFGSNERDIILTHDGVRPFVTEKIIRENINCMSRHNACTTAVGAVDTILHCTDGKTISSVPKRNEMFHAQTPQTFSVTALNKAFNALSDKEKSALTDTCSIFTVQGLPVQIVEGDSSNIKITSPRDLQIAEALLQPTASLK